MCLEQIKQPYKTHLNKLKRIITCSVGHPETRCTAIEDGWGGYECVVAGILYIPIYPYTHLIDEQIYLITFVARCVKLFAACVDFVARCQQVSAARRGCYIRCYREVRRKARRKVSSQGLSQGRRNVVAADIPSVARSSSQRASQGSVARCRHKVSSQALSASQEEFVFSKI